MLQLGWEVRKRLKECWTQLIKSRSIKEIRKDLLLFIGLVIKVCWIELWLNVIEGWYDHIFTSLWDHYFSFFILGKVILDLWKPWWEEELISTQKTKFWLSWMVDVLGWLIFGYLMYLTISFSFTISSHNISLTN